MRRATQADVPQLCDWGRRFHQSSGLPCEYDATAFGALLSGMIESGSGAIIVSDAGFIGGVISPAYCDPKWLIAVELFWWAESGGLRLLRAFEDWASEMGASEIRMTSLASLPRADKLLRCRSYAPTEISYQKVI